MFLHARFVVRFELLHLSLLLWSEQLIQFIVDARLLHLHLYQSLRLLRNQGLHLAVIVRAFHILPELLIQLVNTVFIWVRCASVRSRYFAKKPIMWPSWPSMPMPMPCSCGDGAVDESAV
jgi:hypothetical protein